MISSRDELVDDVASEALCRRCVMGHLGSCGPRSRPASSATMTLARPSGSAGWQAARTCRRAREALEGQSHPVVALPWPPPPFPPLPICSAFEDCDFCDLTSSVTLQGWAFSAGSWHWVALAAGHVAAPLASARQRPVVFPTGCDIGNVPRRCQVSRVEGGPGTAPAAWLPGAGRCPAGVSHLSSGDSLILQGTPGRFRRVPGDPPVTFSACCPLPRSPRPASRPAGVSNSYLTRLHGYLDMTETVATF